MDLPFQRTTTLKMFSTCAAALLMAASFNLHAQTPAQDNPIISWAGSGGAPEKSKTFKPTKLTGKVVRDKDPGGWLFALQPASGPRFRIAYEGSDKLSKALWDFADTDKVVSIEGTAGNLGSGYMAFDDAKPITIRVASGGTVPAAAGSTAAPAPGTLPLVDLEQQLACEGTYQKDIGKRLVAAQLAVDKQYEYELKNGTKLFGFDAKTVSLDWAPDSGAKVTLASLKGKEKDVRAVMKNAGVNLNRKSAPFVVVMAENGGSSTLVGCAWTKRLEMP